MVIVLSLIPLLIGLTAVFTKVAEWFQENKNINIIPAALIDTIAGAIFVFHYGSKDTKDIIWMCVAIAIVLVILGFNLVKYGFKNGSLASIAELVFSISAAFIIACVIIASSQGSKQNQSKHRRK